MRALLNQFKRRLSAEREEKLYQAQDLIFDAWEAPTAAKAKALAKKALKLSEDCADAYTLLASYTKTDEEALPLLQQAVDAGKRAIGSKDFRKMAGEFWGFLETRPYMRALEALGECLADMERTEEAVEYYQQMIALNPHDNQGARHTLLYWLILLGRDDAAETLYAQYKDDAFSSMPYARLLLDYRRHGPAAKTTAKSLKKALTRNPHIAAFLTGHKKTPKNTGVGYTLGSAEEAVEYMTHLADVWQHTPDALPWLKEATKNEPL